MQSQGAIEVSTVSSGTYSKYKWVYLMNALTDMSYILLYVYQTRYRNLNFAKIKYDSQQATICFDVAVTRPRLLESTERSV